MILQRINRTDPEKIFIVCKNSYETAALTNGQAVIWDFHTDVDGVGVTIPTAIATNLGIAAAGVVAEGIAIGDFGLIQVYGFHSAAVVRAGTGSLPIVKGSPLALNTAGGLFAMEAYASSTATTVPIRYPMAFAMGQYSSYTTTTIKAFIKAL